MPLKQQRPGVETRLVLGGRPPQCGFFYVRMPSRAFFYGGPGGASFGWAGFLERRFSTPAVGPATPHVEMSDGPLNVLGARYA